MPKAFSKKYNIFCWWYFLILTITHENVQYNSISIVRLFTRLVIILLGLIINYLKFLHFDNKGWNKDYCNPVFGGTNPQPARQSNPVVTGRLTVIPFMSQYTCHYFKFWDKLWDHINTSSLDLVLIRDNEKLRQYLDRVSHFESRRWDNFRNNPAKFIVYVSIIVTIVRNHEGEGRYCHTFKKLCQVDLWCWQPSDCQRFRFNTNFLPKLPRHPNLSNLSFEFVSYFIVWAMEINLYSVVGILWLWRGVDWVMIVVSQIGHTHEVGEEEYEDQVDCNVGHVTGSSISIPVGHRSK